MSPMPPNKPAAALLIVLGLISLGVLTLYGVGLLAISVTVVLSGVNTLIGLGLAVAKVFLWNSLALRSNAFYLSVGSYFLAAASFFYSYYYGEAWPPFLLGVIVMLVAVTGSIASVKIEKLSHN